MTVYTVQLKSYQVLRPSSLLIKFDICIGLDKHYQYIVSEEILFLSLRWKIKSTSGSPIKLRFLGQHVSSEKVFDKIAPSVSFLSIVGEWH